MFTFQVLVTTFGIYRIYQKCHAGPRERKEKKITPFKLVVLGCLLAVNSFWAYHSWCLLSLQAELQRTNWDPFSQLGLPVPANITTSFNAPVYKKTYRQLAR